MDFSLFVRQKAPEITATAGLVAFAVLKKKLTAGGIVAGILSAGMHMLHPWPAFFWLLVVFFVLGTLVTKIGHEAKTHLTQSAGGGGGGEGARNAAQVVANSGWACVLLAAHAALLHIVPFISSHLAVGPGPHLPALARLLPIGIVAQYAAVAADTFASELGILSADQPFLITAPWKSVPRGTNGGVTVDGVKYSVLGSALLTLVAALALFFAPPNATMDARVIALLGLAGLAGSLIDSVLGALLQVTVTDKGTGKVIEGAGGQRVKILPGGGRLQLGTDLLTNNGVNFVMASSASILAMAAAHVLGLQLSLPHEADHSRPV